MTDCPRMNFRNMKCGGMMYTHIWMFFNRYINFLRMNDWRSTALWKNERLLHVAVDLEQVAPHLPDLCNKKNILEKLKP